jgi:hypothetical protein
MNPFRQTPVFRVSPQIAGAIKAVPNIAQVEAVYAGQRQRSRD